MSPVSCSCNLDEAVDMDTHSVWRHSSRRWAQINYDSGRNTSYGDTRGRRWWLTVSSHDGLPIHCMTRQSVTTVVSLTRHQLQLWRLPLPLHSPSHSSKPLLNPLFLSLSLSVSPISSLRSFFHSVEEFWLYLRWLEISASSSVYLKLISFCSLIKLSPCTVGYRVVCTFVLANFD